MTITYPGGAPSVQGTRLTVDGVLKQPKFLAKRIVPDSRIFLSELLFRQDTTDSGAVLYNVARTDDQYPARGDVQYVEPGAEFPMIDFSEGENRVATARKVGGGYIVTDEAVDRNQMNVVAKGNLKVQNALKRQDAARCLTAFRGAVDTVNATATWDTAKAMRTDVLEAVAQIQRTQLGYTPDTVLINPQAVTDLLLLDELQNLSPRENTSLNPLFNRQLNGYLGMNWVPNEYMPVDEAIVLQTKMTGVNVTEKPFSLEVVREGTRQRTVVIGSRRGMPIIDEPLSALIIKGTAAEGAGA